MGYEVCYRIVLDGGWGVRRRVSFGEFRLGDEVGRRVLLVL